MRHWTAPAALTASRARGGEGGRGKRPRSAQGPSHKGTYRLVQQPSPPLHACTTPPARRNKGANGRVTLNGDLEAGSRMRHLLLCSLFLAIYALGRAMPSGSLHGSIHDDKSR